MSNFRNNSLTVYEYSKLDFTIVFDTSALLEDDGFRILVYLIRGIPYGTRIIMPVKVLKELENISHNAFHQHSELAYRILQYLDKAKANIGFPNNPGSDADEAIYSYIKTNLGINNNSSRYLVLTQDKTLAHDLLLFNRIHGNNHRLHVKRIGKRIGAQSYVLENFYFKPQRSKQSMLRRLGIRL